MERGTIEIYHPDRRSGYIRPVGQNPDGSPLTDDVFFHADAQCHLIDGGLAPIWDHADRLPVSALELALGIEVVYDRQTTLHNPKAQPWGLYNSFRAVEYEIMRRFVPEIDRPAWASLRELLYHCDQYGSSETVEAGLQRGFSELANHGVHFYYLAGFYNGVLPHRRFIGKRPVVERNITDMYVRCSLRVRNFDQPVHAASDDCGASADYGVVIPERNGTEWRCTQHRDLVTLTRKGSTVTVIKRVLGLIS